MQKAQCLCKIWLGGNSLIILMSQIIHQKEVFCSYVLIDGTSPNDLSKQKIIHLTNELLQANMAASSGLRENVYPMIFFVKMFIYIILLYYYNNWHG